MDDLENKMAGALDYYPVDALESIMKNQPVPFGKIISLQASFYEAFFYRLKKQTVLKQ